jgi:hypothetical protein
MTMRTYKPNPGSSVDRAVQLLRFLPAGSTLRSSDLCRRIGVHPNCGIASILATAVRYGLVRALKTLKPGKSRHDVLWMAGDGLPLPEPETKPAKPIHAPHPVRSVFELASPSNP